uniref:NADH dehydrogenase subunit 6 n=1 Tax=Orthione mesoamericana TaxID=2480053 RepID=A0A8K1Y3J4_9CRUS|nr:NADH dehydrogenase subunit 6 [Orthione mesoamericana]
MSLPISVVTCMLSALSGSASPAFLVLILFCQAVITGGLVIFSSGGVWAGYSLWLIFFGSLMVIFIYIVSLTYKEVFSFNSGWSMFLVLAATLMLLMTFSVMGGGEGSSLECSLKLSGEEYLSSKLFFYGGMKVYLYCVSYLLYSLVCVAKIASKEWAPLASWVK